MTLSPEDLRKTINASAWNASFYQVVRLAEQVVARHPGTRVELVHEPDLHFPLSDVRGADYDDAESVVRIRCDFLGLLGASSPLASQFTEQVMHGDPEGTLRELYDVIHHALLESLFLAWRDSSLEGRLNLRTNGALWKRIATFAALDGTTVDAFPGNVIASLSDYQRGQPQVLDGAAATACLRRIFPTLPITVHFGLERLLPIAEGEASLLGERSNGLGVDLVCGASVLDTAAAVRVSIGPVPYVTLQWLMPGSAGHQAFIVLGSRLFGQAVDVELEVSLPAGEVPCMCLDDSACDLGDGTWISQGDAATVRVRIPVHVGADTSDCIYLEGEEGVSG